jgi:uncharacterized Rmd1/YagE family protein
MALPSHPSRKHAAKNLCFRVCSSTSRTLQAQGPHPAPPHRGRLPLDPREPQADPERNTADLDARDGRALPPDASAHAAAAERAPTARRVLGAKVERRRHGEKVRGGEWEGEGRREGEVFVFGNGSFVCWGLAEEDAVRFRRDVLMPARAEVGPLAEPETEELEFATDPSECVFPFPSLPFPFFNIFFWVLCRKTRVQGDLIILGGGPQPSDPENLPGSLPPSAFPQETVLARYAFSQALSRSTALSALETSLEDYLSSMSSLPLALEKTGKPGMGRRALVKKLGELLRFRQGLNLNRENFSETPDFYWDRPVLEGKRACFFFVSFAPLFHFKANNDGDGHIGYFNSLCAALEVRSRTRGVNDKITYAAEVQSVLRQLLHEVSFFLSSHHRQGDEHHVPDV